MMEPLRGSMPFIITSAIINGTPPGFEDLATLSAIINATPPGVQTILNYPLSTRVLYQN